MLPKEVPIWKVVRTVWHSGSLTRLLKCHFKVLDRLFTIWYNLSTRRHEMESCDYFGNPCDTRDKSSSYRSCMSCVNRIWLSQSSDCTVGTFGSACLSQFSHRAHQDATCKTCPDAMASLKGCRTRNSKTYISLSTHSNLIEWGHPGIWGLDRCTKSCSKLSPSCFWTYSTWKIMTVKRLWLTLCHPKEV